jgi:preprotein translocase subunit SecG
MLSFLRDQNNAGTPGKESPTPAGKPAADGAGPSPEQDFLTVAARGKRARKSTTVLAVLFVAGLVCLGFMIKRTAPQAASARTGQNEETKVEAALARLTGIKSEIFGKMDEIVKKFYDFSGVMQVQVNELAKDPFTLEVLVPDTKQAPLVLDTSETDSAAAWRQQLRQKTKDMRLLSIMRSDQSKSCMIGSKILREGDSIQGFTVRQIGDNSVKLQWSGEQGANSAGSPPDAVEIVLTLSE